MRLYITREQHPIPKVKVAEDLFRLTKLSCCWTTGTSKLPLQ